MPKIVHDPIESPKKIVLLPLHVKLGLMKLFVKALDSDDKYFQHIVSAFSIFLFYKIKVGVFDVPQIRALAHDEEFVNKVNDKEKAAWLSFVAVTKNFLGNKKADNYHVLVTAMLLAYRNLGYKMSKTADYCWSIKRDCPGEVYKRRSYMHKLFPERI